jgi:S-adenosylmethionine/arginine decarboxylase-like enzyme
MKRFGEPVVVRFGEDPKVSGYSLAQLIETSLISGHFAETDNSVYIDIFSCKYYDQEKAVEFTKNFFKAEKFVYNVILRGATKE